MVTVDGRTVTLLDAGVGTALLARGLPASDVPERWLLERLDEVVAVHRAHVAAGARAVLTNTFNAHPPVLRGYRLQTFCRELRRIAVHAAREAGAQRVWGVIGPLPPHLPGDQVTSYAESAAVDLCQAGVDGLVVETITNLFEGTCRVKGAAVSGMPVVASLVPNTGAVDDVKTAVANLTAAGASTLGVNCATPAECHPVLMEMAASGAQALWAKPSAGTPQAPVTAEAWVEGTLKLLALGVTNVGGCCGVTAQMLGALGDALKRRAHAA